MNTKDEWWFKTKFSMIEILIIVCSNMQSKQPGRENLNILQNFHHFVILSNYYYLL